MKEKKDIEKRCPWCGEIYNYSGFSSPRSKIVICEKCKKYGCHSLGRLRLISIFFNIVALICLFSMFILYKKIDLKIIIFFCIYSYTHSSALSCLYSEPYERYSLGKWNKNLYSYPFPKVALANITWESFRITNISWLKWKVVEKTILPVCFIDDENMPISLTYCIVVESSKVLKKNHSQLEFHFLLEEAPEELLEAGKRFYIFNERIKIGEGIIKKSWYP